MGITGPNQMLTISRQYTKQTLFVTAMNSKKGVGKIKKKITVCKTVELKPKSVEPILKLFP